jgi:3-oxoacyl-[acyl-carrier protein] reductase
MAFPLRVDGKVAFITGSSRGIGWATAKMLAEAGASVVLHGHSSPEILRQRAEEIRALSGNGTSPLEFCFDLADAQCLRDCYREIFERFRRLDVLVNNAGVMDGAMIGMISDASLKHAFEVNTFPAILNLQEAARLMMRNKSGSVINISSIMGTQGGEGYSVYSSSKAALIGLTRAAAKELAPKNIRVNAVAPGLIRTDMTRNIPQEQMRKSIDKIKMGRPGEPEDVAKVVVFLASDSACYITGQVIGVDGGMYL